MKKNKKNDKLLILSIGITILLVILGLGIYGYVSYQDGQITMPIIAIIVALFAVVISIFYLKNRFSEVEKGYPLADERSNKVMLVAASKAYVISIWFLLIMSYLSDGYIEFRDPGQALGVGILGMAVILGLSWLWYRNKPNIEEIGF